MMSGLIDGRRITHEATCSRIVTRALEHISSSACKEIFLSVVPFLQKLVGKDDIPSVAARAIFPLAGESTGGGVVFKW